MPPPVRQMVHNVFDNVVQRGVIVDFSERMTAEKARIRGNELHSVFLKGLEIAIERKDKYLCEGILEAAKRYTSPIEEEEIKFIQEVKYLATQAERLESYEAIPLINAFLEDKYGREDNQPEAPGATP